MRGIIDFIRWCFSDLRHTQLTLITLAILSIFFYFAWPGIEVWFHDMHMFFQKEVVPFIMTLLFLGLLCVGLYKYATKKPPAAPPPTRRGRRR